MTLLLYIVFRVDINYITNFDMSNASTYGASITNNIITKAFAYTPIFWNNTMFKASGHKLYIYVTML